MELPSVPAVFSSVIPLLNKSQSQAELFKNVQPYIEYETKLRQIFAQEPQNQALLADHLVSIFGNDQLMTKARTLQNESSIDQEKYLLALPEKARRINNTPATVSGIQEFKTNFNLFSEQSLVDLDWSNVIAAGSSVITSLLPVDKLHKESKRALRAYYHEQLAPASDVDLFVYGLNEEQAIEKIKQIERSIRDSVLAETTTIRTKNAITIVSEYPTRHVQVVLRLYKSMTEVLTGFDVDCSCVAYDGKQVWASPRALAAFATQVNTIDLTRRSPSYENRLSKYSHRGFEVYWPPIDRSRIDPTIYERAFNRVVGLARLLVLEKLPHPNDRDSYADKRRMERGRPELPWNARYRHALPGNVKDAQPDDVPDWLDDAEHSDYHSFTIPYGSKYNAKRVEKLLFKKDLLLNAEWNRPKERDTMLHRHPAFFGSVEDVIQDCCGFCPNPTTNEDLKAYEEETKIYISGPLKFMKDNPGRQAIGSFNPLTPDDWTDMAYIGHTSTLCLAIVEDNVEAVKEWFKGGGADVNQRDHTGRTPLQLACMCSSSEIVELLVERGARIVSRLYNGMTALHIAAYRGHPEIVRILLDRSEINARAEGVKEEVRQKARRAAAEQPEALESDKVGGNDDSQTSSDIEMIDGDEEVSETDDRMTEGSFVKVGDEGTREDDENSPDVYNVDILAWDYPVSPLHLAMVAGHVEVVNLLIDQYSADVMLPVKIKDNYGNLQAILNLVLPINLDTATAKETVRTLLHHGASPAQANADQISNLHFLISEAKIDIIDVLSQEQSNATRKVVNHLKVDGWQSFPSFDSPLLTAIRLGSPTITHKVLQLGAQPDIDFETFVKAYTRKFENGETDSDRLKELHQTCMDQPIIEMAQQHCLVDIVMELLDQGIDVNTLTKGAQILLLDNGSSVSDKVGTLLDIVHDRIKELEGYSGEKEDAPEKPSPLPDFVANHNDCYESWTLRSNHEQAKAIHQELMLKYEKDRTQYESRDTAGRIEKKQAIDSLLKRWQACAKKLTEQGARTFVSLHPEIEMDNSNTPSRWKVGRSGQDKAKPFHNKISFQVPDLTDAKRDRYLELFEAVYSGDESRVKAICMSRESPLQIAVADSAGFTPFSLAVIREHYVLARTVLDIAAAQYRPSEEEGKTYRYSIRRSGSEYDCEHDGEDVNDDEDNDVKLYEELVDERITIDDIRLLSEDIKSKTSPAALFAMKSELWRGLPLPELEAKAALYPPPPSRDYHAYYEDEFLTWAWFNEMLSREKLRNNYGLFRIAIARGNTDMLDFLLRLHVDLRYREDDSDTLQSIQINEDDFDLALRLGHTEIISEIIRTTGTLLPIANLASESGIQLDEKPRYYQGLSVHGQKRHDWAQQNRGQKNKINASHGSPLLAAILSGNLRTIEYFLSDTPLRCYEEFAGNFAQDKNIMTLAKSDRGLDGALHAWLDTRIHLAVHMSVMADPAISKPAREFIIKRMPQYVDAKSQDGLTPLQLAFQMKHYDAAKELLDTGADQTTKNNARENLLHTIYIHQEDPKDPVSLRRIVEMLKPDVVASLTLQRSSGGGELSRTPLMAFLSCKSHHSHHAEDILNVMLELSGGKDLEIMDGIGDYPLHSLVRPDDVKMETVTHIINYRPDLLFKENATGMTPLEISVNTFFRSYFANPPRVNSNHGSGISNITDVPPGDFLDSSKLEPQGTAYPAYKFQESLAKAAGQHPQFRTLVSLLDANETARRLAEQQKNSSEKSQRKEAYASQRYQTPAFRRWKLFLDNDQADQDEVTIWAGKAANFRLTNKAISNGAVDRHIGG